MFQEKERKKYIAVHPCFSTNGCYRVYGRIHLPVARNCNIRCNYCLRAFDCPNESRPGVTSKVLSPEEAVTRVQYVLERDHSIKVIGIAGPGDPLCNTETFETMALIGGLYPNLALCLSTNGLLLSEKLKELRRLKIRCLTITVNAIDAEVGSDIYAWVFWKGRRLYGSQGARLLISKQWEGIEEAAKMGFFIKINTVMLPGVNINQIPEIARRAKSANVHIQNIMPLIPVKGTRFANIPLPSGRERRHIQSLCREFIPQLIHCRQCRADAIGLLGEDRCLSFFPEGENVHHSGSGIKTTLPSIKVAVASKHEGLVDLHFGHAREFKIYQVENNGNCIFLGKRPVRPYCYGPEECQDGEDYLGEIVKLLGDCWVLFCVRIGWEPQRRLKEAGIEVVTTYDRIEDAVRRFLKEKGGDSERENSKNYLC